ncbi:MAG: hypothetical protein KAI66_08545, partial [Lentisphaeria bacterium]|nr:hypothetical protein [Lentisphaeria bacterium]
MRAYILRRILISVPLVFLMTFVVFAVINMSPQSAIDQFVFDPKIPAQLVEQEKERTGYYDSLPIRYLKWVCGVFGDIRLGR